MEELTRGEREGAIRALRQAIDGDKFKLADRVKTWKAALAKPEGRTGSRRRDNRVRLCR